MVVDRDHPPPGSADALQPCGAASVVNKESGVVIDAKGLTMAVLVSSRLYGRISRPIIDRTGLTGMFDIHLEFARDTSAPLDMRVEDQPNAFPAISTALLEQLGLKLTTGVTPTDIVVIDHAAEPTDN